MVWLPGLVHPKVFLPAPDTLCLDCSVYSNDVNLKNSFISRHSIYRAKSLII